MGATDGRGQGAGRDRSRPAPHLGPGVELHVELHEGWHHDEVVLRLLGGGEDLVLSDVTTRYQVGVAGFATMTVPVGPRQLEVEVRSRGHRELVGIEVGGETWLGLSMTDAGLTAIVRSAPFRHA